MSDLGDLSEANQGDSAAGWPPLRIGPWLFEPALNRLSRGETITPLEPRLADALLCLARRPNQVVGRRALHAMLWGETVVVEKGLTNVISELRHALEDDPEHPRYIETVRKRGYRLIAPVRPVASDAPDRAEPASRIVQAPPSAPRGAIRCAIRGRRPRVAIAAVCVAVAAALAVLLSLRHLRPEPNALPSLPILSGTPLTSFPGSESDPAISPDGTRVAFRWSGQAGDNPDIYVTQPGAAIPLRLTSDPAWEGCPCWSPDGATVAFARLGSEAAIYTVPALGGPARRLIGTHSEVLGITWSPDGRSIAYAAAPTPGEYIGIMLLSLETLQVEPLVSAAPEYHCAFRPAFSPDGRTLAFARSDIANFNEVYLLDLQSGATRQLTFARRPVEGLSWTPDGRHLIVSRAPHAGSNLWRVDAGDGSAVWMPTRSRNVRGLSVSSRTGDLVYEELTFDCNIWQIPLDDAGRPGAPVPLVVSSRSDYAPSVSPTGGALAFISDRTGHPEIWAAARDGSQPRQLTSLEPGHLSRPIWSPDGRRIAFSCERDGYAAPHVLDHASGRTVRLGLRARHEIPTGWSPEGDWLYLDIDTGRGWQLGRIRPDGSGPQPIAAAGFGLECATRDGRYLIYHRGPGPELYRLALDTNVERVLVPAEAAADWPLYAVADEGIYALAVREGRRLLIHRDFTTAATDTLAPPPPAIGELTVAPDGRALLFSRMESLAADLIIAPGACGRSARPR